MILRGNERESEDASFFFENCEHSNVEIFLFFANKLTIILKSLDLLEFAIFQHFIEL